ncbi:MAG TPA: hypothetical protein PL151_18965 [Phycisphaerae bacterium]|nr:hypothetical protein [Phycisphaerae bacterium]HOJ72721.1 hypothetical protein [Phycisphaerae bacterium]HOM53504.1 hypothetical protein [Phycisphaerae bacterium]HON65795.1 hypothetical protein [Phycisphaerae bacterium]HOQ86398.1 hypothetical protein [Phycisphaerae bacterium]
MRLDNALPYLALWMCSLAISPGMAQAPSSQPAVIARAPHRFPSWQNDPSVRYTITAEEERTTNHPPAEAHRLSLRLLVDVTLTPYEMRADGSGWMRGTLERIELDGRSGARRFRYDSKQDKPGQANATADLLAVIVGREFRIRLGPSGRFEEFTGFNAAWRSQGLLAAPAAVASIQSLFRDHAMLNLLRDALSPPLGRDLGMPGASWQSVMPGEIPGLTLLECVATFTIEPQNPAAPGGSIRVQGQGDVRTIRPDADIPTAGLLAEATSGQQSWALRLAPETHQVISNETHRNVVLKVRLVPPAPSDSPAMTIRQTLRIIASRQ